MSAKIKEGDSQKQPLQWGLLIVGLLLIAAAIVFALYYNPPHPNLLGLIIQQVFFF